MNSVTMAYLKLHWNRFRNAWRPWLIFFFIYLGILFMALIYMDSGLKMNILNNLLKNPLPLFITLVGAGALLGINWIRFGDYEELIYLSGLPLSRKEIASVKLIKLTLELLLIILIILSFFIPWGKEDLPGLLFYYLYLVFLCLNSFYIGMFFAFLAFRYLNKAGPYLAAFAAFVTSYYLNGFVNTGRFAFLAIDRPGFYHWLLLLIISILTFYSCRGILPVYFAKLLNQVKAGRGLKEGRRGLKRRNMLLAIAYKDLLYLYRDGYQILQSLLFTVLVIFLVSRKNIASGQEMLIMQIFLFTVPFTIAGQLSTKFIGSEGFLLEQIKMIRGTLKAYYLCRLILSILYVTVPVLLVYMISNFFLLKLGLTFQVILLLLFLIFISNLAAAGVSVIFMDRKPLPGIPGKGIRGEGLILYFITGMGLPIVLAYWNMGVSIGQIPLVFNIYGLIHLIFSLAAGVAGYFMLDRIVIK